MTHWRKYVSANNPNLHHWDIEEFSPVEVTIEKYGMQDVHGDGDGDEADKPMCFLWFKGGKKPLGINATNGHILSGILGADIEGWVGKAVTLRRAEITSGGKKGEPCIRVDAPVGFKLTGLCPKFKYTDKKKGA